MRSDHNMKYFQLRIMRTQLNSCNTSDREALVVQEGFSEEVIYDSSYLGMYVFRGFAYGHGE